MFGRMSRHNRGWHTSQRLEEVNGSSDVMLHLLSKWVPESWVYGFRDSGNLRSVVDGLVSVLIMIGRLAPSLRRRERELSQRRRILYYGPLTCRSRIIESYPTLQQSEGRHRPWIMFVHGGAWGSGRPFMYRLMVDTLLGMGFGGVLLLGYRTYPDAGILEQVDDVLQALRWCQANPTAWSGNHTAAPALVLCGHSSGANLILQVALRWRRERDRQAALPDITAFVGLSTPAELLRHESFEAGRGGEKLSTMTAAAAREPTEGISVPLHGMQHHDLSHRWLIPTQVAGLLRSSPTHLCRALSPRDLDSGTLTLSDLPNILLAHGTRDTVLPPLQSSELAELLRERGAQVDLLWLTGADHTTFTYLMFPEWHAGDQGAEALWRRLRALSEPPLRPRL